MNLFSRSNLINLLITKSVAEALLVTATAVGFYLVTTNPNLRGWLDQADQRTVSGWVVDDKEAGIRVEVQLYVDDKFVADRSAADFRPDVHQARRAADDWHGFVFTTPELPKGEHEAKVYAVYGGRSFARRTLQIIGQPLRFRVEANAGQTLPK